MYKLKVTTNFSAAHRLDGYQGDCANLHGHNWRVQVGIICLEQDDIGLTIDFKEVKKRLNQVVSELDHKLLNDLPWFRDKNPTSEELARHLYNRVKESFNDLSCQIAEVEIWESENSSLVYSE
ncbi:MAG: 6-carboxytetrahydropterin synthase QueD [Candidatus Cloacimonetes bacterium]|nr:6-carboxytetrahydropterin synthase QueD [Candidatus Cloacimonadota bacterium]